MGVFTDEEAIAEQCFSYGDANVTSNLIERAQRSRKSILVQMRGQVTQEFKVSSRSALRMSSHLTLTERSAPKPSALSCKRK